MKNLIYFTLASIIVWSCGQNNSNNPNGFELKGNLVNSKEQPIYLERLTSTEIKIVDSAMINSKGEFLMNNVSPQLGFYRLRIDNASFAILVLDSSDKVTLTGDFRDLTNTYNVEGSPETKIYLQYSGLAKNQKRRTDSLENVFKTTMLTLKLDSLRADSLSRELQRPYELIVSTYSDLVAKTIKENSNSFASIMAIQQLRPETYLDVYKVLDKNLKQKYPLHPDVDAFHNMLQQAIMMVERTAAIKPGSQAPEIILPMPNDKEFSLSSLKGKVVLIDFWASWCGPCRKELPNVKRCYQKFKSKGFEVLGVSLDKEKSAWLEAITKEGLTWPQVSDLKFWNCEAAQTYAVQSIPFTVLVDREGKIIATDLRGTELEKKLAEILK